MKLMRGLFLRPPHSSPSGCLGRKHLGGKFLRHCKRMFFEKSACYVARSWKILKRVNRNSAGELLKMDGITRR